MRQFLKMRASCLFLVQLVTMFAVKAVNSAPVNKSSLQGPPGSTCNKAPTNNCNCHCNVFQDSRITTAVIALEDKVDQLIELVNKTAPLGSSPAPPAVAPVSSCKEQFERNNSSHSQVYELTFGSQKVHVYCHMGNFGCGDGGWTLAMKTDGTKRTFHYDSHLWNDMATFNLVAGQTGFDMQETKLPTYWNTPFSKLCLGMRIGQQLKFVAMNLNSNSLFSLIADGNYRRTFVGRNTWKSLIGSQASLQRYCHREGFNAESSVASYSKARIGIIGNEQNTCSYCDSRIGFGTGGRWDDSNTCGNEASRASDNGNKAIKAMGYILVQ
ncbi:uncharacterized skeletal organic matrix protein 5-like isoform X1 [Montipora foliosa]|uniref:uncharacterized skeletal organic matrix protein 5-like isoform X1 n=1 Tax=Montipora foliosa TaxID=591990 RepID=UPI0035F17B15